MHSGRNDIITWDDFSRDYLPTLQQSLPTAMDRMELHKNLINQLEFCHGFTLENLEHFWNIFYKSVDTPVSHERLQNAAAFQAPSPELISRDQFKLTMVQKFKVSDVKLTNSLFMLADEGRKGALDVRVLLANILFWLKGEHDLKWALFFDIFSQIDQMGRPGVKASNIIKMIVDATKIFKETFFLAKTASDKMNTSLNGQISFEEFKKFCTFNP